MTDKNLEIIKKIAEVSWTEEELKELEKQGKKLDKNKGNKK